MNAFLLAHTKLPTSVCLSDAYFALTASEAASSSGAKGKADAAVVDRVTLTTSEQLLWSLLAIMAQCNGNVSGPLHCLLSD